MWGKKKKKLTKAEDDKKSGYQEKDKIFNNTYGEQDLGGQKINFTVSSSWFWMVTWTQMIKCIMMLYLK